MPSLLDPVAACNKELRSTAEVDEADESGRLESNELRDDTELISTEHSQGFKRQQRRRAEQSLVETVPLRRLLQELQHGLLRLVCLLQRCHPGRLQNVVLRHICHRLADISVHDAVRSAREVLHLRGHNI